MKTLTIEAAANNDVVNIIMPVYAYRGLPDFNPEEISMVIRGINEELIDGMRLVRYVASSETVGMYFTRYSGFGFDKLLAIKNLTNQAEEKYRPFVKAALATSLLNPRPEDVDPFSDDPIYKFDVPEEF